MAEPRPLHISAFDQPPDFRKDDKPAVDAGDAATLKDRIKETKSAEQVRKETVRNMMLVEDNRKYFFDLLEACHLYSTPYSPRDPYATTFACGEHNIGLRVLSDLQLAAPDLYLQMLEENKNG